MLLYDLFCHKMVHAGVKVFERNSNARSTIEFRICQEGLDIVLPYMTKRVTRCERVTSMWVVIVSTNARRFYVKCATPFPSPPLPSPCFERSSFAVENCVTDCWYYERKVVARYSHGGF